MSESDNPIYVGINYLTSNENFNADGRACDNEDDIFVNIEKVNTGLVINKNQPISLDGSAKLNSMYSRQMVKKGGQRLINRITLE